MTDKNAMSTILQGASAVPRAFRGTALRAKNWRAEALLRMFENVLEVGENPAELVVYASLGKAARNWDEAQRIAQALLTLEESETLVLQTGGAIGIIPTHIGAPMVVSAVNNTVGNWSGPERFYERLESGDTIWGGLTAAAWQYIGRQGVLGGTYELLRVIAERHFGGSGPQTLAGIWMLTAGMGGMGSSQPISAKMLGISSIVVEVDVVKAERLKTAGGLDEIATTLDEALDLLERSHAEGRPIAIGLVGNASDVFAAVAEREIAPSIVTDQTAAHDPRYGYLPSGYDLEDWVRRREEDPQLVEADAQKSIARQVEAMLTMVKAGSVAFENGNNLRVQALTHLGEEARARVDRIPGFMDAYLRPLFSRGIGPFRWVALSGDPKDLALIDDLVMELFPARPEIADWIRLAQQYVPEQGLPARSCWLGHGERAELAVAVNDLVAKGALSAPVLFSRDHLDSAGMTNPRIGTEGMRDGSDGVTDWPLLDAMLVASTGADMVVIHSGGGGYSGWMQSTGVSIVADGATGTAERLQRTLNADSGLGVLRHATAGYEEASTAIDSSGETGRAPLTWLNDRRKGSAHA
ncbi:Urocanate hydratase [Leifsonia rubra CMS 76R]|nr:Urocanate hydratase [Leifsonia rubra CMS 76R]